MKRKHYHKRKRRHKKPPPLGKHELLDRLHHKVPLIQDPVPPKWKDLSRSSSANGTLASGGRTPPRRPLFPSDIANGTFIPRIKFTRQDNVCLNPGFTPTHVWGHVYEGLLVSEGHKRLRSGAWSGGGGLYVHKESLTHDGFKVLRHEQFGSGGSYSPGGVIPATSTQQSMPLPVKAVALADAVQYSLSGYNKTRPGNPVADAFVASKETYADGLPSIPLGIGRLFPYGTDARGFPLHIPFGDIPGRVRAALGSFDRLARVAGKQYLNVVFGWAPFLRDLRKLFRAMQGMQASIDKIIRENGRKIHRKAKLFDERTVTQTGQDYPYPYANVFGAPPNFFAGVTSCTTTTRTRRRAWYSAAYRYWIPDTNSLVWRAKAFLALLGALPTPGALWHAMPWTWFTDWFVDLGDLYESLSPNAVDGLVQLYGFTMLNTLNEVEYRAHVTMPPVDVYVGPGLYKHTDGCNRAFKSTLKVEKKIRTGGYDPFGRDLKGLTDLSVSQLAVLAALGLSRVPKVS